jgi:hypothetical protein
MCIEKFLNLFAKKTLQETTTGSQNNRRKKTFLTVFPEMQEKQHFCISNKDVSFAEQYDSRSGK